MLEGNYNLKVDFGGLYITYSGMVETNEGIIEFSNPYDDSNIVWSCQDYEEIYETILNEYNEHGIDYVVRYYLDGIVSDLCLPIPA